MEYGFPANPPQGFYDLSIRRSFLDHIIEIGQSLSQIVISGCPPEHNVMSMKRRATDHKEEAEVFRPGPSRRKG